MTIWELIYLKSQYPEPLGIHEGIYKKRADNFLIVIYPFLIGFNVGCNPFFYVLLTYMTLIYVPEDLCGQFILSLNSFIVRRIETAFVGRVGPSIRRKLLQRIGIIRQKCEFTVRRQKSPKSLRSFNQMIGQT